MSQILELKFIKINDMKPNPYQPRVSFDKDKLKELANSLKESDLLQPIIVKKHGDKYQIIAGERRWRAARLAGIEKLPAIIKDTANKRVLLESFIENVHREDLTSIERENAIYELWKSGEFSSHRDLARAIGYHNQTISDIIEAKEFRKRAVGVPDRVSTTLISETQGLDDKTRSIVLQKAVKGEITQHPINEVRDIVSVLKKAPQPLKKALISEELKIEDAKEAVKLYDEIKKEGTEIKPEKIVQHVEELKKERKQAEIQNTLRKELHKEVLTGKKRAADLQIYSKGADFIIEVKDVAWKVKGWGVPTMMEVGSKYWKDAKPYFKQIRDHMDFLLRKSP